MITARLGTPKQRKRKRAIRAVEPQDLTGFGT